MHWLSRTNHTGMGNGAVKKQRKQMRGHGVNVQEEVRREIWTRCSDEFAADTSELMMAGGRGRSVPVLLMILR